MQFAQNIYEPSVFRFTLIPDKTNDVILLKSPKTLFWGRFLPILAIFA